MEYSKLKNRRHFIRAFGLGTVASTVLPAFIPLKWQDNPNDIFERIRNSSFPDEAFWQMVKNQFTVSPDLIMVNSANLCPCPYFVNEAVEKYTKDLARDVSFQHRSHFTEKRKEALQKIANYLGTSSEHIGITRNTSEANNIVVNGLDLDRGDEIIVWNQNHPSNLVTWKHRAKRYGFTVKEVHVPTGPKSKEELIQPFLNAITPKTRLISFSHISNVSGIALPANAICEAANSRNILTLVDGAQTVGFLNLNLENIGCSFYSSSSHKWLMGPMENGILYVNPNNREKLWPNIIAAGWNAEDTSADDQLCVLGQRNTPSTAALSGIVDFHNSIGKDTIEKRIYALNTYLKKGLISAIPKIEFVTPILEELSGGVTIFNIPGKDPIELFQKLYSDHGIACAPTGGIRFSPTINSTVAEIDRVVEAVASLA